VKVIRQDSRGITIVELLISITLISILSIFIMNFMANWLQQHIITQTRADLLMSAQDTLDLAMDNIRLSSAADQANRIQDPNAPLAPADQLSWRSNANTLILASAAEDAAGEIIFSDSLNYTSVKNNIIFFVRDGTLYRRTLAAPVEDNKAKTTCPNAVANSECPQDRRLAQNVSSFQIRYLNAANQQVDPVNARSVELSIVLQKKVIGKTVESSDKVRMVFRND
jgi:Tfp pilus assembly protein PilE